MRVRNCVYHFDHNKSSAESCRRENEGRRGRGKRGVSAPRVGGGSPQVAAEFSMSLTLEMTMTWLEGSTPVPSTVSNKSAGPIRSGQKLSVQKAAKASSAASSTNTFCLETIGLAGQFEAAPDAGAERSSHSIISP